MAVAMLDRKAARERVDNATEGPWITVLGSGDCVMTTIVHERATAEAPETPSVFIADCLPDSDHAMDLAERDHRPNMRFISHARTDLPEALDLLDRCESLLQYYHSPIECITCACGEPCAVADLLKDLGVTQ